ncbi:bifunctional (p)ppGpp synthetase/guanosine-3',5'-bis(diphosphate) 3'-pyrophosphohydrolase [Xanthomonas campestris pv. campestris]|uniref:guanosine-3',5'-bis(diphosphate) 3'-diphosphatase n=1 Tax=Xanthomonas campestris pv. campestris (strain ATCC 33913 / DSM 3586 / NCPPB 528 / LMG 568 / P 25) TaxID=190485 RepID=Q8P5T8_XANCP|nr:bifunctional (p)ppGpp synthetase/guanosine-3',5'-bis(diphosphate) 3'-pyrophosphohydrolase [Xanthomonas campestris]AAM42517.1 pentaphosphate guanosine-3'-pyrophosphohydrolase [Xanthomonas campestris pv. campestris str. ATCC 33913]MCC5077976.1 bifunctional (p)ppGpp synthetase/guanosine-3',5'-bis(diphosphate) 3'-pyrophosphohydrolase [Xanthomonas campestris pv. campestris]MEB1051539.1 bifunctional (p)ppGpp synthetase/guanosine-3',5'-bis(diphosphate) 3'-pyrophosphohydrolase [Xanthomonas campestris
MNPGPTAQATVATAASTDAAIPDYVLHLERAASYLPKEQLPILRRAWEVGASAHAGQTRKSGEPYITHPVAVAGVLAELGLDMESLIAAILHDTIEDTPLTREELASEFGEAVAELVDGVTKLDKLKFRDRQEAAAESFRKMLLAMSRDLRVIMIKLADRLHNMRTLGAQSTEARGRIARETLEIYAPIAQRLGMSLIKSELQNLGFRALYPWRHAIIEKHIRSQPVVRRESMAQVEVQLSQRLAKEGLEHRLVSRIKTPWSIYSKMHEENKSFDQVMDVFGFRLVVRSVADCYHALGAVHATFKPLDGRFRDFIAIPKANGYQSLHTVLFGPYGSPIEVQIRTEEMDLIAERGVAAHWTYKVGSAAPNSSQSRAHDWIVELIDSQRAAGSSLEFLDNVKVDLFPDEVYLFTPKGKILALPRNSTALDFAYAVHTDVGNRAVASRVDKKLVPLRTKLVSGQAVEIITARSATPKPQWLEFVVSSKARTAIRHQLKQLEHEDAVQLGHRMLDRALEAMDSSLERLPKGRLDAFLSEHRYPRLEALLADVALGNWMPTQAAQALMAYAELRGGGHSKHSHEKILIDGSERGVISFANCCQPIPGDEIMGYHTAGKGIVVHRLDCPNLAELRKSPERWVPIDWDSNVTGDYDTALVVEVENRTGVLAQLAAAIAQSQSNIERVDYLDRDFNAAVLRFNIQVRDRRHLAEVMRRLRRLHVVQSVGRQ